MSATVVITAISSSLGFLLNSAALTLVLWRGRQTYHYLFAGFLAICALWDLGVALSMIRNDHVDELPTYGTIIWWPCLFMFALIYHFACSYTGRPRKWRTRFVWAACTIMFVAGVLGLSGRIIGVWHYSWGNIYRPDDQLLIGNLVGLPLAYYFGLSALWYLFSAWRRETSRIRRRHLAYVTVALGIVHVAVLKVAILYGIDNNWLMPVCMACNDVAVSLIGVALVKYRLLDVTVIIKKTTLYSAAVALIILVFSVSEHFLASFVGELSGESSAIVHVASVAIVVAVLMPIRKRGEAAVEGFFARRTVSF